jgi:hypothetical protein
MSVGGCQIWAVSRMGKNGPFHFWECLTCVQAGVRLGIVVKEKDVFRVSVKTNSTDALSQFFKYPCTARVVLLIGSREFNSIGTQCLTKR